MGSLVGGSSGRSRLRRPAVVWGGPRVLIGEDGKTAPVYDYTQAVRERVFIPQPGDRPGRQRRRWTSSRPTSSGRRSPARRQGAGDHRPEPVLRPSAAATRASAWPTGTATASTTAGRCSTTTTSCRAATRTCWARCSAPATRRRAARITAARRTSPARSRSSTGSTAASTPTRLRTTAQQVVADWHNGSSAMIGKSYDGTLANGVAATGVEGLKTIVPVSAISAWYHYSRTGGVRHNTNYPGGSLNPTVTTGPNPPDGVNLPNRAAGVRAAQRDREHDRRRRARRRQRVLARPRLRQGREQGQGRGLRDPRLPGRQRPHGPPRAVVGRAEGQRRAAQAVAAAPGHTTRSSSAAPSGSTRCTAGSTTTSTASTTASRPSRCHGRGREGRVERLRRVAGPGHAESTCSCAASSQAGARHRSPATPAAARADTLPFDGSNSISENGYINNPTARRLTGASSSRSR